MNEPTKRDEFRPAFAALQMPQQTPPVDRVASRPGATDGDASGVEASGFLDDMLPRIVRGIGGLLS
ncbi:hypothetical protein [Streptomyces sp. TE33382]